MCHVDQTDSDILEALSGTLEGDQAPTDADNNAATTTAMCGAGAEGGTASTSAVATTKKRDRLSSGVMKSERDVASEVKKAKADSGPCTSSRGRMHSIVKPAAALAPASAGAATTNVLSEYEMADESEWEKQLAMSAGNVEKNVGVGTAQSFRSTAHANDARVCEEEDNEDALALAAFEQAMQSKSLQQFL